MSGDAGTTGTVVVLLHGYSMTAQDLEPFGRSLGLPATFVFPQGPLPAPARGQAWWAIDEGARQRALQQGPRDLSDQVPAGLAAAREALDQLLAACEQRFQPRHLVLGGFSQGGMLACDWLTHGTRRLDALLLYSASCLNLSAWRLGQARLRDLPVLIGHGRQDADLAFEAGLRLRDFALDAGAQVTWVPFEGGHEMPLPVWRATRKFLQQWRL